MNAEKQTYLTSIRENTAYPTYRGAIGLLTTLGYILAGFYGLAALIAGIGSMGNSFLGGLAILFGGFIMAGIIFLGTRLGKEAALVLVDIGDSTIDKNSK